MGMQEASLVSAIIHNFSEKCKALFTQFTYYPHIYERKTADGVADAVWQEKMKQGTAPDPMCGSH